MQSQPITCEICNRTFSTQQLLKEHQPVHWKTIKFSCHTCRTKFPTQLDWKIHWDSFKSYTCKECGKSYQSLDDIKSHLQNHDKCTTFTFQVTCGEKLLANFEKNEKRKKRRKTNVWYRKNPHLMHNAKRHANNDSINQSIDQSKWPTRWNNQSTGQSIIQTTGQPITQPTDSATFQSTSQENPDLKSEAEKRKSTAQKYPWSKRVKTEVMNFMSDEVGSEFDPEENEDEKTLDQLRTETINPTTVNSISQGNPQLNCQVCAETFMTLQEFTAHWQKHDQFSCKICGTNLPTIQDNFSHSCQENNDSEKSTSDAQDKVSPNELDLQRKADLNKFGNVEPDQEPSTQTEEQEFKCKKCFVIFRSQEKLDAHLPKHYIKINFSCELCPFHTEAKQTLRQHYRSQHSMTAEDICMAKKKIDTFDFWTFDITNQKETGADRNAGLQMNLPKKLTSPEIQPSKETVEVRETGPHNNYDAKEIDELKKNEIKSEVMNIMTDDIEIELTQADTNQKEKGAGRNAGLQMQMPKRLTSTDIQPSKEAIEVTKNRPKSNYDSKELDAQEQDIIKSEVMNIMTDDIESEFTQADINRTDSDWPTQNAGFCELQDNEPNLEPSSNELKQLENKKRKNMADIIIRTKKAAKRNLLIVIMASTVQSYACLENCGKSFSSVKSMMKHHQTHKPFSCPDCGKSFHYVRSLNDHQRKCGGVERTYTCTECQKSFKTPSKLRQHNITHFDFKPFSCENCDKSFYRSYDLKQHQFTHTKEKKHKCTFCDRSFSLRHYLVLHERTHTGSKPFSCKICQKSFAQSGTLKAHTRKHTGEKPYKCFECEKTFSQANHLKTHSLLHMGVKPFQCNLCDKTFTQKCNLNVHSKIHHKKEQFIRLI